MHWKIKNRYDEIRWTAVRGIYNLDDYVRARPVKGLPDVLEKTRGMVDPPVVLIVTNTSHRLSKLGAHLVYKSWWSADTTPVLGPTVGAHSIVE